MQSNKKHHTDLQNYARYSALGIELVIIVLLFVFGGVKLDSLLNLKIPIFTLLLTFIGLVASMYVLIRKTKK